MLGKEEFNIQFKSVTDTVQRDLKKELILSYEVSANGLLESDVENYSVTIAVDVSSTLSPGEFRLERNQFSLKEVYTNSQRFYIHLKPDALPDRDRMLVLKIKVSKEQVNKDNFNTAGDKEKTMTLVIKSGITDTPLTNYRYLVYAGTNFDLVDGIRPKNLFFATNINLLPDEKRKCGLYISLYGNRSAIFTDSTSNTLRDARVEGISDTTARFYRVQSKLRSSRTSDNFGAYVSTPIQIAHKKFTTAKLYYCPSIEFIWRRTESRFEFTDDVPADTVIRETPFRYGNFTISPVNEIAYNEYQFNMGILGFMFCHETDDISVRLLMNTGPARVYFPQGVFNQSPDAFNYEGRTEAFFTGRVWITEANSGVTFQAEVTNTLNVSRPFYNVTLSKAINYKGLGALLKPITSF
jgi:hypothetical protein